MQTHTRKHTDHPYKINFRKPGMRRLQLARAWLENSDNFMYSWRRYTITHMATIYLLHIKQIQFLVQYTGTFCNKMYLCLYIQTVSVSLYILDYCMIICLKLASQCYLHPSSSSSLHSCVCVCTQTPVYRFFIVFYRRITDILILHILLTYSVFKRGYQNVIH